MEIRLLPEETISRIAAGEVIERPLNVVKELVENSIDAGSTAISVEIRDGGISMIRVTDNGCGIERDQITKAFIRHATSKITNADDLSRLSSLGFRGEALASIAAVAQVEMITKVHGAVSGTRAVNDHLAAYSPDAPVQIDLTEIGAPDGTTVIVRNLFGSIPVRRRFLRQPQTEAGYITDLLEKQALSHPRVSFHYRVNGQDKLHTTGNGNLKELIYRIYGRETAGALVPVHAEDPEHGMTLDGFLGKPEVSRSSRSFETFFINGRMLHSKELSAGLEEGYRTDLMQHRFPFAVLHLCMPPETVDVNVHPSKMEVRFTDRRAVFDFLNRSVHDTLHGLELIPKADLLTARQHRQQARKEARLKEEVLKSAPRFEPFEAAAGRYNSENAAGRKTSADAAGGNTPAAAAGRNIPAAAAGGYDSSDAGQAENGMHSTVIRPAGSLVSVDAQEDGFVFEDRRAYGNDRPANTDFSRDVPAGKPEQLTPAGLGTEAVQLTPDGFPAGAKQLTPAGLGTEAVQLTLDSLGTNAEKGRQNHLLSREKSERYKYIGQVFGTYWIIEYEKRLLIIDQHAAHEKVNYERMMRRIEREHPGLAQEHRTSEAAPEEYLELDRLLQKDPVLHASRSVPGEGGDLQNDPADPFAGRDGSGKILVASQQLLPPLIIHLSGREESAYREFHDTFAAMGYEIEEFGSGSYAIRAVPTELFGQSADSLLREVLEEIMNERISGTPRAVIAKVASMSCKAAVKGNRPLSEREARALIEELLSLDNPYHCPHGRPTMVVMNQQEMDRKFKRIL
ncbi:MAG: DNA mismatch repair endonuclease MutL [Eubacteriales bacterium]|nr:DNA mismatch repair endonuclease MutL [Eubacteriales bacterium]